MLSQLTHAPPPYPLLTQKILLYTNYVKLTNPLVTGLLLQSPPPSPPSSEKKKKRFKLTFIPVGDRSIFITVGEMRRIIVATTEHLCIYLFFDSSILSMEDFVIFPPPLFFPTTSKSQCYYLLPNPQTDKLKFYNSAIKQNTNLFFVVKMADSNGISLNNRKCGGS